jgi:hypothetical protein
MNWSRKRIIVACVLTAAIGLMLCPPWLGSYRRGHRLLWNGRGSLDWSRLALEFCLIVVIGALALVLAPMIGHPSIRALKTWFRRSGVALGCVAVVILAAVAGYDGIARVALVRDYNRSVQGFQAKEPLLREAFPLDLSPTITTDGYQIQWDNRISNVHEAELMLRTLGCDDHSLQQATARFLSASTPEYDDKTLSFGIGFSGEKSRGCALEDIFDKVSAQAKRKGPGQFSLSDVDAPPPRKLPPPPPGFIETVPPSSADAQTARTPMREITFTFRVNDTDAAKRFFAPLPDWWAEALQHNIEVASVPDWMKPGEPPAPWSFSDWLGSRRSWLILAAGMLAASALCFVVAGRIDRTMASTE